MRSHYRTHPSILDLKAVIVKYHPPILLGGGVLLYQVDSLPTHHTGWIFKEPLSGTLTQLLPIIITNTCPLCHTLAPGGCGVGTDPALRIYFL